MKKFRIRYRPRSGQVVNHIVLVDDEDAYLLRAQNWVVHQCEGGLAVRRNTPTRVLILSHEILGVSQHVYHRNGNGLDNRRANLTMTMPKTMGCHMRHFYERLGCYRPYYSELRP